MNLESDAPGAGVPHRHPIEFTATGSEYFRIWIVNLLLILVTLGIYLPWAKVRKLKYFYSNTWVDGDALDFHGGARSGDDAIGLAFSSHPATAERIAYFRDAPED